MEWLKRMNLVLDYIENNLDGEITDNKIAMLSASPKGMFQRFFAIITDMTLSEYIRKRKLTQAAVDIRNTDQKVIDIAVKYGYNSANAFSSAFKNFHGITPSEARISDNGSRIQSFQRFTLKLVLSIKGGNDMQYRIIEAEDILRKMVGKEHSQKHLNEVAEHNGVKCACDGCRVGVILPEGIDDWDFSDAYFDTGDENIPKFELYRAFTERNDESYNFEITKEQASGLIGLLNHIDDLKDEFKLKVNYHEGYGVSLNVNTMEIIEMKTAKELADKPGERIIAFNVKYLTEALNFVMCSEDETIEVYYNGNTNAFVMKSSRLYAAVLPVRIGQS